ncbi:MAG: hypothetical protein AB1716_03120 [Planctomycetota bacterium]
MIGEPPPVVRAAEHPLLPRIPVPEGFQLSDSDTRARNSGAVRAGQFRFRGDLPVQQTIRFYEHHMPTAGFRQGSKLFNGGECTIRFESDSEECNVWIKPGWWRTTLIIDVGPLPGPSPSEREAVSPARRS